MKAHPYVPLIAWVLASQLVAGPAIAEKPAPLVNKPATVKTEAPATGAGDAPAPAAEAKPAPKPKPTLYDPGRPDPAAPRVAPPALPPGLPGLPDQRGRGRGARDAKVPLLPPGMTPVEENPEQAGLALAKSSGVYLGIVNNERVWRHDGKLFFDKPGAE